MFSSGTRGRNKWYKLGREIRYSSAPQLVNEYEKSVEKLRWRSTVIGRDSGAGYIQAWALGKVHVEIWRAIAIKNL